MNICLYFNKKTMLKLCDILTYYSLNTLVICSIHRLRNQLQDMEHEQTGLVSSETVEKYQTKISELQQTLSTKEAMHRGLIQRYSLLKSVIEQSFVKITNHNAKYAHRDGTSISRVY